MDLRGPESRSRAGLQSSVRACPEPTSGRPTVTVRPTSAHLRFVKSSVSIEAAGVGGDWWKVRSKLGTALEPNEHAPGRDVASTSAAEIVSDLFVLDGCLPPPNGRNAFARLAELQLAACATPSTPSTSTRANRRADSCPCSMSAPQHRQGVDPKPDAFLTHSLEHDLPSSQARLLAHISCRSTFLRSRGLRRGRPPAGGWSVTS